jgi:hypothetical protein
VHDAASLRLRELTQGVYDIGDEVADYIDNVAAAMTDWDAELVADCLEELAESVAQGRGEVRRYLAELNGLRQAFVSGVRSGSLSAAPAYDHPGRTLSFLHPRPSSGPAGEEGAGTAAAGADPEPASPVASTATVRLELRRRNTELTAALSELAEWVVDQTARAVGEQSVLLPQALARAERHTIELVDRWQTTVVGEHPVIVAEMRGEAPPEFLAERARVERVVAKIRRRRAATG